MSEEVKLHTADVEKRLSCTLKRSFHADYLFPFILCTINHHKKCPHLLQSTVHSLRLIS